MEIIEENKNKFFKLAGFLMIVLSVFFLVKTISEIKNYNNLPDGSTAVNTISFSGTGEISAVPDLATISFSIIENAADMKIAQNKVSVKENAVLSYLDKNGIAKKDIKTENYNSYPKYQYQNSVCPQPPVAQSYTTNGTNSNAVIYCPPSKQVLIGYEVSENISVQIHDLTKTGDLVKGIGALGVSNMNGPNFSIEKEDQLKEQARKIAIEDAKTKAKALASDLGVSLVRIINFSENGNYPVMYASAVAKTDSVANVAVPSPVLPAGENKVTSNVTITYEIR